MTGRQALKILECWGVGYTLDKFREAVLYLEGELKVLEILKNVLCFRLQLYDVHSDGSYKSYEFLDVKDDINSLEGKERYKIIKQWLKEE